MQPGLVIVALWVGFAISWFAAAAWRSRPEKRIATRTVLVYRLLLLLGGILLAIPAHNNFGPLRLWYPTLFDAWLSIALMALGFAFCWWARLHLGALWSGEITKKPDHHVVDTGPYGLVRHPIYSGILLAVYATVAVKGLIPALIAAPIITLGLWLKAHLEEGWLRQELTPDAYDSYRRRVPMLLPFMPRFG